MNRFRFLPSYHFADSTDGIIQNPAEPTLRDYTITGSEGGVGDCAEKRSDIPSGYEQLAYLESTGTQYIDTGIMNGDIVGFDIRYQSTGYKSGYVLGLNGIMGVNGIRVSSTNPRGDLKIWFVNNPSGTGTSVKLGVQVAYPTTGTTWSKSYESLDSYYAATHHVKLTTDGTLYYNEEAVQNGIVLATPSGSISVYLFRAHNLGNASASSGYDFYSYTRMYYAKFYRADNTLLGDFVPCKRVSDGVLGMYDAVSGTFFTNKGTGTFLSAPLTYTIPILNNGTKAAEIVRSAPLYAGESISYREDGLPAVSLNSGSNALTIGTAVQPGSVTYRYDTYESEDTTGDLPPRRT